MLAYGLLTTIRIIMVLTSTLGLRSVSNQRNDKRCVGGKRWATTSFMCMVEGVGISCELIDWCGAFTRSFWGDWMHNKSGSKINKVAIIYHPAAITNHLLCIQIPKRSKTLLKVVCVSVRFQGKHESAMFLATTALASGWYMYALPPLCPHGSWVNFELGFELVKRNALWVWRYFLRSMHHDMRL